MRTVLVAEDNAVNRELVAEMLEAADYAVLQACDGEDAIAMLEVSTPDIVLLDMQMPRMDGLETLQAIRAREEWKRLPVIACTAFAMHGEREVALHAGFDEYVSKPMNGSLCHCVKTRSSSSHGIRESAPSLHFNWS